MSRYLGRDSQITICTATGDVIRQQVKCIAPHLLRPGQTFHYGKIDAKIIKIDAVACPSGSGVLDYDIWLDRDKDLNVYPPPVDTKFAETLLKQIEFLDELDAVCIKHGLSISHEDRHGAFEFVPYSKRIRHWFRQGQFK